MTLPIKSLDEIEVKAEVSENDKILILDSESEEARLASKDELKGDKGDQWDKGDKWDKGDTWPQWPKWDKGDKGDKWDTWATGAKWDKGDTWYTWPQWPQWPQGAKWDKGDKGDTWNTWPTWPQGEKWDAFTYDDFTPEQLAALTWPKGDKWDKWDKWDKGDKWDTWASIISASFVNTDLVFSKDDSTDVVLEWAETTLTWPQWPKWDTGNTWPKGDTGASIVQAWFSGDDMVFTKDDSTSVTIENAKVTLTWPQGEQGIQGIQWVKWDTWAKWDKGDKWDQWIQGIQWETGNWISSITSSKSWKNTTVTITETNGTTDSFVIQDWADWEWSWDMLSSVYDPDNVADDAFDYNNMKNKPTIPTKVSDLTNDSWFITKAVNDLTNYYTKTQTYTKSEVDTLISNFGWFEVVSVLPTTNIKTNVIYLLWPIGTWADRYEEWIYYSNTWTKIWETSVDLTNYFNKTTDDTDDITEWTTNKFVTSTEKSTWNAKQNALTTQTAYTSKGSATKVPQITTNTLGQVTGITEVTITQPDISWKADKTNVLEKDNTTSYTPTANYHPATKKYVDDWLSGKQATISDLETIRTGAWKWATAVQPWDLATIATSGNLSDANGDSDDITEWTTNLFLTSAERTKLSNTSWTNSWDETASTIKTKLWITTLSWSNTGDETASTIKTKLWITTLSWSNTWDETTATIKTKLWAATSSADWYLKKEDFATFNWKQDALVSGTNIKTINNTSVLWTWNIAVQPTLVSWTNIKTINWNSILGSWNITVSSSTTTTCTLTSAWWSSNSQTVSVSGVTASNTVIVSPAPSDIADYADCGVYCSAQGSGTLTFGCDTAPSGDIVVNVLIMS